MKSILKLALVAVSALALTATVGLTIVGCGDDTAASTQDLAQSVTPDLSGKVDLASSHD
jgi:hypothetical protein